MNDDRLWDNSLWGSSPWPILYILVLDLNDAESSLVVVPGNQGSFFDCVCCGLLDDDFLMTMVSGISSPQPSFNSLTPIGGHDRPLFDKLLC
jgi:hypothetical protein